MAYFHFLIDVSLSNQHFKQHATFSRLMDQIDHLAELNQHTLVTDLIGCTFFARDVLQTISPISNNELKKLLNDEIDFYSGTSILDAIGKTTSLLEESNLEAEMEKHLLIFSDFEENSSSFYTVEMIGELIAEYRQKKNWEFYAFGLKLSHESLFQKMNFNSKKLIFLDT